MKRALVIGISAFLAACVGASYRPLVDSRNVDMNKYEGDLRDCQQYAEQVPGAGTQAAVGAAVGAGLGYLIGRAAGARYNAPATGRVGAVAGAAGGAGQGEMNQRDVIRRCMSGRGYSVLQ